MVNNLSTLNASNEQLKRVAILRLLTSMHKVDRRIIRSVPKEIGEVLIAMSDLPSFNVRVEVMTTAVLLQGLSPAEVLAGTASSSRMNLLVGQRELLSLPLEERVALIRALFCLPAVKGGLRHAKS